MPNTTPGRTLKFYGVSDDLCDIDGTVRPEPSEIGVCSDERAEVSVLARGKCPTCGHELDDRGALVVTWQYTQRGTWSIGIAKFEEEDAMPDWPMRWGHRGYSTTLEIDVPPGTVVRQLYPVWEDD